MRNKCVPFLSASVPVLVMRCCTINYSHVDKLSHRSKTIWVCTTKKSALAENPLLGTFQQSLCYAKIHDSNGDKCDVIEHIPCYYRISSMVWSPSSQDTSTT